jgi:hypothetical protein
LRVPNYDTLKHVEMGCIWSVTVFGGVPLALDALFQTIGTGLLGGVARRCRAPVAPAL